MASGDAEYLAELIAVRSSVLEHVAAGDTYIRVRTGTTETTVTDPQKFLAWLAGEIRRVDAAVNAATTSPFRLARLKRARA